MAAPHCSQCGAARETRHCDHCGHNEPEQSPPPSSPAIPPSGKSINDVYRQHSQAPAIMPVCAYCGADVALVAGILACPVCDHRIGTDGAILGRTPAPVMRPNSRCFGEDCAGVARELMCGYDESGKMLPAKLTCPVCGSQAEPDEAPVATVAAVEVPVEIKSNDAPPSKKAPQSTKQRHRRQRR